MLKRVLCIGDSLGLPRPGVDYTHTWVSMLREQTRDRDFIALFRRSGTTEMLSEWEYGEYLYFYNPSEVILQLGICDCAPRYMRTTSLGYRLLAKMPKGVQNVFWPIYKKFVKRSLNRTDVSIERFEHNLENYLNQCCLAKVERVIIIKVATPGPTMVRANPLVERSVERYNAIYDLLPRRYPFVTVINPLCFGQDEYYAGDGYHPNEAGNREVMQELQKLYA
ncbi:SGNH/GDSL hydrolase family protein [uncultured Rikenella sp.]|nr:SGNH/GDSL hydrolase family protein [uncultured Rikenella sp.]